MTAVAADVAQTPIPPPVPDRHPTAFWFIFWGELAERCSYYGMRSILPLYLTSVLAMPDTKAGSVFYWFKMACYFLPLLGGYVADRFLGKYWTIVGFSVPYILGHFILGMPNTTALAIALLLLAAGSGVIKPNISTLMGLTYDQKRPGREQLRSAAFIWFYFAINVGAVLSTFALPSVRDRWGYGIAFQFPAWLMVVAFLVFAAGKPYYAVEKIEHRKTSPEDRKLQWQTLSRLLGIFGLMVFFWVGYEQNDSLWVYFARDYVDRSLPGLAQLVPADQIMFVNPLFVLLTIPFFGWLFRRIDPQARTFTATRKILMGFVLGAAGCGILAAAGYLAQLTEAKVTLAWMIIAYLVISVGEVLLYGTGLELAYTLAPPSMKGFTTACFLLTITLADFINSWLCRLYGGSLVDAPEERGPLSPGAFFGMTALIVAVAAVGFFFVARRFDTARSRDAEAAAGVVSE